MVTFVEIITSPNCPHSPKAVRMAQQVVGAMPNVHFVEVSMITSQGQQIADNYGVNATPAITINGRLAYVGVPNKKMLFEMIDTARKDEAAKLNYFF